VAGRDETHDKGTITGVAHEVGTTTVPVHVFELTIWIPVQGDQAGTVTTALEGTD
jgi:hypothetical protein